VAHRFDASVDVVEGDDGGLADNDAFTARVNARVGRTKIDSEIVGEP
jgi:hypothetical protein